MMTDSGFFKLLLPQRFHVISKQMNIHIFYQWINYGIKKEDNLSAAIQLLDPKLWQCSIASKVHENTT